MGRGMGRGGDLEASVRKVLPKDEQIVVAMIGVYAGIFGLVKIKSALSAKPPVPKAAAVSAVPSTGSLGSKWGFEPPRDADDFDRWEQNEENWKAWEKFMDGTGPNGGIEEWCKTLE